MATLEADGVNGATLLGFLTAVGSLRLLSLRYPSARLWFEPDGDRARLSVDELDSEEAIFAAIAALYFSSERTDELNVLGAAAMPKSVSEPSVLQWANAASDTPDSTIWSFVTGLLCDGLTKSSDSSVAAESVLCAANGASHQKMFQSLRDLHNLQFEDVRAFCPLPPLVVPEHLQRTLKTAWTFTDSVPPKAVGNKGWMGNRKPTLRWDESAERIHALRFYEPNADPEAFTTQFGAYALASCALPCFPTAPVRDGGMTAFTRRGRDARQFIFYWPLWSVKTSIATFLAAHASGEALERPLDARRRGIYRLMSACRITQDKGRLTFQSPEAVW